MQDSSQSFFSTPNLAGLIQQLKHLSTFGADALVVEGGSCSGKTTLCLQLAEELRVSSSSETPIHIADVNLADGLSINDLLLQLAASMGLPIDGAASAGELLKHLRSYIQTMIREQQLVLVLVDGAHCISDEALGAMLSLLQGAHEQSFGMRYVFFSESGLVSRLDGLAPLDLAIYDFDMPEFSALELEKFIQSYLPEYQDYIAAGRVPAVAMLWNKVSGNPGQALAAARSAISAASEANVGQDFRRMPILHIGALVVLVAGLIMVLLYSGGEDDVGGDTQVGTLNITSPESAVSAGAAEKKPESVVLIPDLQIEPPSGGADQGGGELLEPGTSQVRASLEDTLLSAQSSSSVEGGIALSSGLVAPEPGEVEEVSVTEHEPSRSGVRSFNESLVPEVDTLLDSNERLLLSMSDTGYVLQLVAVSKREAIDVFMSRQGSLDGFYFHRKLKASGASWYIAVLGPYESRKAAQLAVSSLPDGQRLLGPWPKSVRAVKLDIEEVIGK